MFHDELLLSYFSHESVTVAIKTNTLFFKFFSSSAIPLKEWIYAFLLFIVFASVLYY